MPAGAHVFLYRGEGEAMRQIKLRPLVTVDLVADGGSDLEGIFTV